LVLLLDLRHRLLALRELSQDTFPANLERLATVVASEHPELIRLDLRLALIRELHHGNLVDRVTLHGPHDAGLLPGLRLRILVLVRVLALRSVLVLRRHPGVLDPRLSNRHLYGRLVRAIVHPLLLVRPQKILQPLLVNPAIVEVTPSSTTGRIDDVDAEISHESLLYLSPEPSHIETHESLRLQYLQYRLVR